MEPFKLHHSGCETSFRYCTSPLPAAVRRVLTYWQANHNAKLFIVPHIFVWFTKCIDQTVHAHVRNRFEYHTLTGLLNVWCYPYQMYCIKVFINAKCLSDVIILCRYTCIQYMYILLCSTLHYCIIYNTYFLYTSFWLQCVISGKRLGRVCSSAGSYLCSLFFVSIVWFWFTKRDKAQRNVYDLCVQCRL